MLILTSIRGNSIALDPSELLRKHVVLSNIAIESKVKKIKYA
jgi:hypothetical protein